MDDKDLYVQLLREVNTMQTRLKEIAGVLQRRIAQESPHTVAVGEIEPKFNVSTASEILDMSDEFRKPLIHITRHGKISLKELSNILDEDEFTLSVYLKSLITQGYLTKEKTPDGQTIYKPIIKTKKKVVQLSDKIWNKLQ